MFLCPSIQHTNPSSLTIYQPQEFKFSSKKILQKIPSTQVLRIGEGNIHGISRTLRGDVNHLIQLIRSNYSDLTPLFQSNLGWWNISLSHYFHNVLYIPSDAGYLPSTVSHGSWCWDGYFHPVKVWEHFSMFLQDGQFEALELLWGQTTRFVEKNPCQIRCSGCKGVFFLEDDICIVYIIYIIRFLHPYIHYIHCLSLAGETENV